MKNFQDKTIVITGAGSGLGQMFAIQFYQAGAFLALCDLNQEALQETLKLIGDSGERVKLFQVDVSDQNAMEEFAQDVEKQLGPTDVLINNAGVCLIPQAFELISVEQFTRVLEINFWGAYYGIRSFLPQLKSRPEASIVNVSSLAGIVGLYGHSAYSASKSAMRGLTETLQSELSGTKVQITLAHPGGVKTNLIKNAPNLEESKQEKAHRNFTEMSFLSPEMVVSRIIKAIQKKKKRIVIGWDAKFILLIRKLFPNNHPNIIRIIFSQANFIDDPFWK